MEKRGEMVSDENQREIQKINKIAGAIDDLRPVFSAFLPQYRSLVGRNFETEGVYFGQKFKPLSAGYRQWKERFYPGQKILQLTRRMITAAKGKGADSYEKITPNSLEFGIRAGEGGVDYAKKQQEIRPFFYTAQKRMPIQGVRVLRAELEKYVQSVVKIARDRGLL